MNQYPPLKTRTETGRADSADKKMMGGSFAVSFLIHGTVLLLVSGFILVPAIKRTPLPITPVTIRQDFLPEPPKEIPPDESKQSDGGNGSPLNNEPIDNPIQPQAKEAGPDILVTPNSLNHSPRVSVGAGGVSSINGAFSNGRPGPGTGPGLGGPGLGVVRKTIFNPIGSKDKSDNSFVGRFYDLKQDRSRKSKGFPDTPKILKDFITSDFSTSKLSNFFSPPDPLYAPYIMVPVMPADVAPKAYNVEKEVQPTNWLVHYQAMVAPTVDGTYRFDGVADDYLVVGVNGKVILDGSLSVAWGPSSLHPHPDVKGTEATNWKNKEPLLPSFRNSWYPIVPGDWVEWKAGEFKKMDIVISERPGGQFCAILLIEEKGKVYQNGSDGCPILPVFRVDSATVQLPAEIDKRTYPEFIMGPVFKARHVK